MSTWLCVDNPATGELAYETEYASADRINPTLRAASQAQQRWQSTPLAERQAVLRRFLEQVQADSEPIAVGISEQMGKPLGQARGEVGGMVARATRLVELAPEALADRLPTAKEGFERRVRRVPLGTVVVVAPWNYPLLTVTNALVGATLAGNSVVIKPSPRTPQCVEQLAAAFARAGAPDGLVQSLLVDHWTARALLQHPEVAYVAFTGSVRGGYDVNATVAAVSLAGVGLELGGKDAAYVAADADLEFTVPNVVEGALYNAGQSCCAVERVYVHRSRYAEFIERATADLANWLPAPPTDPDSPLGPMALPEAPAFLHGQVADAITQGARLVRGGGPVQLGGAGRWFEPTLLVDCDDSMRVMREESFGPIVAVAAVDSDDEATRRINDSEFGLTASIWTQDLARAERLAPQLQVGTVFANRCDFLDPDLPWTGVKHSGRGSTLGVEGFDTFTRAQSLHFRLR